MVLQVKTLTEREDSTREKILCQLGFNPVRISPREIEIRGLTFVHETFISLSEQDFRFRRVKHMSAAQQRNSGADVIDFLSRRNH